VIAVARETVKELTLKSTLNKLYETVVPMKSRVILDIFALHRNELVWKEPEVSMSSLILCIRQIVSLVMKVNSNHENCVYRKLEYQGNWE